MSIKVVNTVTLDCPGDGIGTVTDRVVDKYLEKKYGRVVLGGGSSFSLSLKEVTLLFAYMSDNKLENAMIEVMRTTYKKASVRYIMVRTTDKLALIIDEGE